MDGNTVGVIIQLLNPEIHQNLAKNQKGHPKHRNLLRS